MRLTLNKSDRTNEQLSDEQLSDGHFLRTSTTLQRTTASTSDKQTVHHHPLFVNENYENNITMSQNAHLPSVLSRAQAAFRALTPVREQESDLNTDLSSSIESHEPDELRSDTFETESLLDAAPRSNDVSTIPVPDGMVPSSTFITPPSRVSTHPGAPENIDFSATAMRPTGNATITPRRMDPDGEYRGSQRRSNVATSGTASIDTNRVINNISNLSIDGSTITPMSALIVPPTHASNHDIAAFFGRDLQLQINTPDPIQTIKDLLLLWGGLNESGQLPASYNVQSITTTFATPLHLHFNDRITHYVTTFGKTITINFIIACTFLNNLWENRTSTIPYRQWLAAREHFYLSHAGVQRIISFRSEYDAVTQTVTDCSSHGLKPSYSSYMLA